MSGMNPFKPTAGKMPPILIGRQGIVNDFEEALDNGAGAPGRLMLITGQRGFGKTVMLTELGRVAVKKGWQVISETASKGLCTRLVQTLSPEKTGISQAEFEPSLSVPGLGSVHLGKISLESSGSVEDAALQLRSAIEMRLRKTPKGKGIVFTIDEAQAASRDDMVALATTIQHIIRDEDMKEVPDAEEKGIAFVFAGLPSVVDELVNDEVLTFLRRSMRQDLGPVQLPDVQHAYVEAVTESGKTIGENEALQAAQAAQGYPYMIQLIGYYMWQAAKRHNSSAIESQDIRQSIQDSVLAFGEAVCAPAFKGLMPAQQEFLEAMVPDYPHASKIASIARRTQKSCSWANKYRASLIQASVIEPVGRGLVGFKIPHFGEYLQRVFVNRNASAFRINWVDEPETTTYALVEDTGEAILDDADSSRLAGDGTQLSFTPVDIRDEAHAVRILQELLDQGCPDDQLVSEFKRRLESSSQV